MLVNRNKVCYNETGNIFPTRSCGMCSRLSSPNSHSNAFQYGLLPFCRDAPYPGFPEKGGYSVYEMTTLFPAEQIGYTTQTTAVQAAAAGTFAPSNNPITTGIVFGLLFGFLTAAILFGRFAGCYFCRRRGEIGGVYKSPRMDSETRTARYCPICGRKLHR